MQSNTKTVWYLLIGAVLVVGVYLLGQGSSHDLSQPPVAEAPPMPRLQSDSLPKRPIVAPVEQISSPWTEPSPATAVAAEADRRLRENEADQQRQMMEAPATEQLPPDAPGQEHQ